MLFCSTFKCLTRGAYDVSPVVNSSEIHWERKCTFRIKTLFRVFVVTHFSSRQNFPPLHQSRYSDRSTPSGSVHPQNRGPPSVHKFFTGPLSPWMEATWCVKAEVLFCMRIVTERVSMSKLWYSYFWGFAETVIQMQRFIVDEIQLLLAWSETYDSSVKRPSYSIRGELRACFENVQNRSVLD